MHPPITDVGDSLKQTPHPKANQAQQLKAIQNHTGQGGQGEAFTMSSQASMVFGTFDGGRLFSADWLKNAEIKVLMQGQDSRNASSR